MDRLGLIAELPDSWPIWASVKSANLMRLTTELFEGWIAADIRTWHSWSRPFKIGSLTITAHSKDHSAFDA